MKNTKCLIVTYGFFGDILFASSIADGLKKEKQFEIVDYLIGFPQMKRLLENNPNIDSVFLSDYASPSPINNKIDYSSYDKLIELKQLSFELPPPEEFQIFAGVKNPDTKYKTYTESDYDKFCKKDFSNRFTDGRKIIAIMKNWQPKTYLFTEEQYDRAIDVPNFGYGGRHRDVGYIIKNLSEYFNIVYVGMPHGTSQFDTQTYSDENYGSLLYDCSIIKNCDAFVGTEGGLANIAAGVGTKTIITGDFVHQLYGPKGVIKQIEEPKLGPKYYFPNSGHVTLNPFLTDEEVYEQIIKELE